MERQAFTRSTGENKNTHSGLGSEMASAYLHLDGKPKEVAGTGKPVEGDLGAAGTPDAGVKGFKEGQVIP